MQTTLRYDHYKVLGVARDASYKEIKQAYRERVKQCHPDRNDANNAAELFRAVHDAYHTLADTRRRAEYDAILLHYREVVPRPSPEHSRQRHRTEHSDGPDRPVARFAFVGLHLTGLLFGVALVLGILIGITFFTWPLYTLFFCAPGLAVIPDSIDGLRAK
jgi:hypothetical protein